MIIELRTTTGLFKWITLPSHIFRVCCSSVYKDEETKAVRKADFITRAVSAKPAIGGS